MAVRLWQSSLDGAHVAEVGDDEGVGQVGSDLLEHTDEDPTWEQLTSLDEDED